MLLQEPQDDDNSHVSAIPSNGSRDGTDGDDSPRSGSDHFPFITKFVKRREISEADLWLYDLEAMCVIQRGVNMASLTPTGTTG